MIKKLFEDYLKKNYEKTDFELKEIKENDKYYFGYLFSKEPYDVPILVCDKNTNEIKDEVLPPFTNDEGAKTIYEKKFDNFKKEE